MNQSPMSIDWRFNVMSTADRFSIRQHSQNRRFSCIYKPYLNATFTGDFDQIFPLMVIIRGLMAILHHDTPT
jgi:hypothetical protein